MLSFSIRNNLLCWERKLDWYSVIIFCCRWFVDFLVRELAANAVNTHVVIYLAEILVARAETRISIRMRIYAVIDYDIHCLGGLEIDCTVISFFSFDCIVIFIARKATLTNFWTFCLDSTFGVVSGWRFPFLWCLKDYTYFRDFCPILPFLVKKFHNNYFKTNHPLTK